MQTCSSKIVSSSTGCRVIADWLTRQLEKNRGESGTVKVAKFIKAQKYRIKADKGLQWTLLNISNTWFSFSTLYVITL